MVPDDRRQALRLKISSEAFDVLQRQGSDALRSAELLRQTISSEEEPHPRVVREVHEALLDAQKRTPPGPAETLRKISGIFSRRGWQDLPEIIRRFEEAFGPLS